MTVFLIADKETESQRLIKSPKVTQTDFVSGISKLKAHEFCFLFFFLLFFFITVRTQHEIIPQYIFKCTILLLKINVIQQNFVTKSPWVTGTLYQLISNSALPPSLSQHHHTLYFYASILFINWSIAAVQYCISYRCII